MTLDCENHKISEPNIANLTFFLVPVTIRHSKVANSTNNP
jgi:hypothetical protein